jgi:glycosyltransferase involved in cell wall biosynthesis
MRITAVIPTLNRPCPLSDLLHSFLGNTLLPTQIVIVDQSDSERIRELINSLRNQFISKGVSLEYYWREEKSVSAARNFGVRQSTGDFVSFFDDDLILSPNYFETINTIFENYPDIKGVQGYISNDPKIGKVSNVLRRLTFADHIGKESKIIPSFRARVMAPEIAERIKLVPTDYINGVASYRLRVFKHLCFDEKLTKYSLGEDRDFAYRVSRLYPNSLVIAVEAKVIHKHYVNLPHEVLVNESDKTFPEGLTHFDGEMALVLYVKGSLFLMVTLEDKGFST